MIRNVKKSCYRREIVKGFKGEMEIIKGSFEPLINLSPLILPVIAIMGVGMIIYPLDTTLSSTQVSYLILMLLGTLLFTFPQYIAINNEDPDLSLSEKLLKAYKDEVIGITGFCKDIVGLFCTVLIISAPTTVPVFSVMYIMARLVGMNIWVTCLAVLITLLIVIPVNYAVVKCSKLVAKLVGE